MLVTHCTKLWADRFPYLNMGAGPNADVEFVDHSSHLAVSMLSQELVKPIHAY